MPRPPKEAKAAELSFGRLRLFRGAGHLPLWAPVPLGEPTGRAVVGEWVLEWKRDAAPERLARDPDTSWFADGSYVARPWQPGDRIRPLGATGRRLVVRCMQDARIARSRRATWPVIAERDAIVIAAPSSVTLAAMAASSKTIEAI